MATAETLKPSPQAAPQPAQNGTETRQQLLDAAMKLVRIRITCMNPQKSDLPGEIITVGNNIIGTVRKYIPFGEGSEKGWHVPHCIYEHLRDAQYLQITVRKSSTGRSDELPVSRLVPEYAIEVLPPLSQKELEQLAIAQLRSKPEEE